MIRLPGFVKELIELALKLFGFMLRSKGIILSSKTDKWYFP